MGVSKAYIFQPELQLLSVQFHALGHPARLSILEYLMVYETTTAVELLSWIPLSQPTLSHHIQVLHRAGFLQSIVKKNKYILSRDEHTMRFLQTYINEQTLSRQFKSR
ncbi:MAG: helix-turn-helix domain-containing protein [Chitinophagales bacterium]